MKKILSTTLLAAALVGVSTSCSDEFLQVQPTAVLGDASLTNRDGVNFLLIGAYSMLDGVQTNVGSPNADWHGAVDNWVYGSVMSDDAYKGSTSGDQPEITFIESYNIQADNSHFAGKWRAVYDGVARSNDVILMANRVTDMSDAEKTQARAQARFLRGHYHFEAKKMWNMVPYVDETIYNPLDANSTKVPNDKNIWPNIEADLKFAYDNLPERQTQPGRATKWAAGAMLAKAMLFQNKFAEAKPILEAIVASNRYRLVDNYFDNYRIGANNNAESVFEVQFSVNDGATISNNGNRGATLNYPNGTGTFTTCCGFFQPSQNLVNAFKTDANGLPLTRTFNDTDVPNDQNVEGNQAFTPATISLDPRLDYTAGRRGIPYLDWGVNTGKPWVRDQNYSGPYIPRKHVPQRSDAAAGWTWTGNPRQNANNYRMIKYSHVLLWLAEIETEQGNLTAARNYVNQIRRRAANPAGFLRSGTANAANYVIREYAADSPAFSNQANARDAVRMEQRLEFAMEGHRFFDLVRWGIADQVLNEYVRIEQNKRQYLRGSTFVKGKHEYFPIPVQEIFNSKVAGKETLKQNPQY
ncbi:MAG: RagB/SusD family nutrient uptake outer membrane protein [Cytophagia bacterium]|nr:MAG: RagB/SusD family nutrient uptake outer membrane protein [Runella sp.]TAG18919.1 MAG: RagB/SusD family nutrient uptake outer membrane protein [Cytophagales bacterium]TAG39569.1 MAG: RagB/SusD family nutrient uptake outer membrane protein [Cytophagia bacterium]TAG52451.1 MAG: RagB/SusD family nutrient uptake outer membrane protein [Runella slithyformis]TAG81163.1 MAG: RagB/SusD family nutrient uptake outer membrane protein [Cytophagales bacterium]